ncbi:hypothetical protein IWX49DRAFT_554870 [Phyllosticta citricarpa]
MATYFAAATQLRLVDGSSFWTDSLALLVALGYPRAFKSGNQTLNSTAAAGQCNRTSKSGSRLADGELDLTRYLFVHPPLSFFIGLFEKKCDADLLIALQVNPKSHSDGAYYFHSDHFSKPLRVGPDGFLMTSRVGAAVFCLYDTTYGKPIIPPGQMNTLASVASPAPKTLQSEINFPGFKGAQGTRIDCFIACAANGMAPDPRVNSGIEFCFRNIVLGPCIGNAPGRACASGKFVGIVKLVGGVDIRARNFAELLEA